MSIFFLCKNSIGVRFAILIHQKMAETYRDMVAMLIRRLQEPDGMLEAKDALREPIERIVLKPSGPDGKLPIQLEGALAQLLILSLESKTSHDPRSESLAIDKIEEVLLAARGRNRRCLPSLSCTTG